MTDLERRIQALLRECDALRVAATPVLHQKKPIWCSEGCPSLDNIPPVPDDVQDVEGWLSSKVRVEKFVGVWGSGHHRVFGQIGGARSFQVGSSHRGCLHARGRCVACIEQSRRGGCETEVSGRQVSIADYCGESSPLSRCGTMVQSARVVRSVHSRHGLRGIRVGEASNPGLRAKRRRRVVVSGSDTELDPESTM